MCFSPKSPTYHVPLQITGMPLTPTAATALDSVDHVPWLALNSPMDNSLCSFNLELLRAETSGNQLGGLYFSPKVFKKHAPWQYWVNLWCGANHHSCSWYAWLQLTSWSGSLSFLPPPPHLPAQLDGTACSPQLSMSVRALHPLWSLWQIGPSSQGTARWPRHAMPQHLSLTLSLAHHTLITLALPSLHSLLFQVISTGWPCCLCSSLTHLSWPQ